MTHPCEELLHETVYENNEKIALSLPLTDELKSLHSTGTFPIVENPSITKKALIMGMFVMRPARDTWTTPVSDFSSLYNIRDWCFNFKGLDGGGLIADGSVVDGYRLALHYGICDAVMVGSQTIAAGKRIYRN